MSAGGLSWFGIARLGLVPAMLGAVVVLTTSAEHVDVQTAYQLGANSYIVKPVEFEKFMDVTSQIDLYWTLVNQPPN